MTFEDTFKVLEVYNMMLESNQIKVTVVNLLIGIYMQLPWYLMCYFLFYVKLCVGKKY